MRRKRDLRGERGTAAVLTAVMVLPVAVFVGVAVDSLRGTDAKVALQSVTDSAVLAAVAGTDQSLAGMQQVARDYVTSNVPAGVNLDPMTGPSVDASGEVLTFEVTGTLPTSFMRLAGFETLTVEANSSAQRTSTGAIELALVLDVTASMADPPATGGEAKLRSLSDSANALVDQIMVPANKGAKIGIVPYSGNINVGFSDPAPSWVTPRDRTTNYNKCTKSVSTPNCNVGYYDCYKDGFLKPKACYNSCQTCTEWQTVSTVVSSWAGCVGPRNIDLDGSVTTKYLDTIDNPTEPTYPGVPQDTGQCSKSEVLGLTDDKAAVKYRLGKLAAAGDTYLPGGLTWGWNLLTPGEPYEAETKEALAAKAGRKALLLITDGVNTLSQRTSDGYLIGASRKPADALTATLCEKIKADGIRIFTVWFDVNDATAINLLKACASPGSAFPASDRTSLLKAFSDINVQLKQVKLVK